MPAIITPRRARLTLALVAVACAGAAALPGASSPTVARKRSCFGAAARDPQRRCDHSAFRLSVVPSPREARGRPNSPCAVVEDYGDYHVCAFGTPASRAVATIALLGDSHAAHWRAALDVVARAKRWHGLSIALSGCPYSTATRVLPDPLHRACVDRNAQMPAWFADHPEVHTVFVSELSGARWMFPPGSDQFESQVAAYVDAWSRLPPSVEHVVVIRDSPKAEEKTRACIERAVRRRQSPGPACAVPRRRALDRDAAVEAAARMHSARFQVIDMTRWFCDRRLCYPVIGGALVQKDLHHLTAVFVKTLGPYLLRAVDALLTSPSWAQASLRGRRS